MKANKGSPGVDGMSVDELGPWLATRREALMASLVRGDYRPQPVKGRLIPKPGGGMRQLGIPTVIDRLVQQAILQILQPILDPTFSASSFGFRPGRGAHDALAQAQEYVAQGHGIVVDLDLEKFFDRVNHDILMARLARRIGDKRLLRIVRRFLEAGMMQDGVCARRWRGTPQGGPLSPLLANLLLDDLDKMLEARGHRFCRYADDCNIYVRSRAAGERVMARVTEFLEGRLHLKVNQEKSAVAPVWERSFLGHRLLLEGRLGFAPKSLARAKQRLRQITKRNRGVSLERVIAELNAFLSGWLTYFRHAQCKTHLHNLDAWLRRRLRALRLKHCKRAWTIARFLMARGVPEWRAWILALSGKGWWRKALGPSATEAMTNAWFGPAALPATAQPVRPGGVPRDFVIKQTSEGGGGRVKFDDLDARMRVFETAHDHCVLPGIHMVARIDGRNFTRLARGPHAFEAPYDEGFRDHMVASAEHLMRCGFRVVYAYTQSDEINLVLHRHEDAFARKLRKLNSVLAAEASAVFSLRLGAPAAFDCRISQCPDLDTVVDYLRWRSEDAHRNALNGHCYWTLRAQGLGAGEATRRLDGLSVAEKNEFLFRHAGVNFNDLPAWQRRGIALYWEDHGKEGVNPKTGGKTTATRRRIRIDGEPPMRDAHDAFVRRIIEDAT